MTDLLSGRRTVSWFSCGAASAVATKLALQYSPFPVVIVYCDTFKRKHPDNQRFFRDCEKWFGQPILIIGNDDYNRDPDEVFLKTRFLIGPRGARCTAELKRAVRLGYQRPDDRVILGYTTEEYKKRYKRTAASEPFVDFWPILHEHKITKSDCLRIVAEAGIQLPAMYHLGYRNNNCIGCVKGGIGYWNKVRRDFPDRFNEMAIIERKLGRAICKDRRKGAKSKFLYLDELPPDMGRYEDEPDISCGIICQSATVR